MQTTGLLNTRYFPSYEARETALDQSVGHLIPCRHNGPRRFWQDFKNIAAAGLPTGIEENMAYVSADPRDSLAFGSPLQVLSAACMCAAAGQAKARYSPRELAAGMEIEALLNQPIRTLSGGESVKLALAKALAASGYSAGLVASSPFSWLSRENQALFDRVLDGYRRQQKPVALLALEGEDDPTPIHAQVPWEGGTALPEFCLVFSGVQVAIGSPVNAVTDVQLHARVADFSGRLVSPCLLEGGNGQGKSLLAKALAGAIATRGRAVIESGSGTGRSRLLFQDVITQTLLRSFHAIVASVKPDRRGHAMELYRQLNRAFTGPAGVSGDRAARPVTGEAAGRRTLLEIKTALVAVRLAERPPALILDELYNLQIGII